jgi:hypothetical protein
VCLPEALWPRSEATTVTMPRVDGDGDLDMRSGDFLSYALSVQKGEGARPYLNYDSTWYKEGALV